MEEIQGVMGKELQNVLKLFFKPINSFLRELVENKDI